MDGWHFQCIGDTFLPSATGCAKGYSGQFSKLWYMAHYYHDAYELDGNESYCLGVCRADPACLAFDRRPEWNRCFFQTVTKDYDLYHFGRDDPNFLYYERLCNA